jgi:hypothetical protein
MVMPKAPCDVHPMLRGQTLRSRENFNNGQPDLVGPVAWQSSSPHKRATLPIFGRGLTTSIASS